MKIYKSIRLSIFLFTNCIPLLTHANIFNTQHIKGYDEPSLSIIGEFAINQDSSSYEVLFDSDNDGDEDKITISSNANSTTLSTLIQVNNGTGEYTQSNQNLDSINLPNQVNVKLMNVYIQDLNNDGLLDLWFHTKTAIDGYNYSIDNSFIYKNNGNNEFEKANSFYTESHLNNHSSKGRTVMIFEDVNDDGFIDPRFHNLYVHDFPAAQYQLITKDGFNFEVTAESSLAYTKKVIAFNYNNDGYQDLISLSYIYFPVLDISSPNLMNTRQGAIWVSNENGGFSSEETQLPLNSATNIWAFDVNNDNKDDVLINYRTEDYTDVSTFYLSGQTNHYNHQINLNDVVLNAKFADMNNDNKTDIVVVSPNNSIVIYENSNNTSFTKVNELGFLYASSKNLILDDMNEDGKLDILTNTYFGLVDYFFIATNQGGMNFGEFDTIYTGYYRTFITTDTDLDGIKEIMVSPVAAKSSKSSYILKRNQNNQYDWIESDLTDVKNGKDDFFSYTKFIAKDMDNDGRDDVVALDIDFSTVASYSLKVLMHEQRHLTEYYNNADVSLSKGKKFFFKRSPTFDVSDFNGDGLKDIVFSGDNGLSIMTQTPNPKIESMYYDPSHNGHGYSLENIGRDNLYYNAFFTYDENGEPDWFLQLSKLKSSDDGVTLDPINPNYIGNTISYLYDHEQGSTSHNLLKNGFIRTDSFDSENFDLSFGLEQEPPIIQWQTQRLISKSQVPENDFSGMWWAGVNDSGWGVSILNVQRADRVDLIAVLYFYDSDGNPRWLMGQAENFIPKQSLTLDMSMIQGYARDEAPLELVRLPAGQMTLTLNEASQDLSNSGTISMNVHYPLGNQEYWIRNNVPFTMLSKPRN